MYQADPEFLASALDVASRFAASRIQGVVDRDDIAQETVLRIWKLERKRAANGLDPLPTDGPGSRALIAKVAKDRIIDEYRRSSVRPAASLDAMLEAGGADRLSSTSADDPAERFDRWEQALEEVTPMLRLRDELKDRRGDTGERIYNGLRDGRGYRQIVEDVCAADPRLSFTEAALRRLVARAVIADPALEPWLRRRIPPTRLASRGGGSRRPRPAREQLA